VKLILLQNLKNKTNSSVENDFTRLLADEGSHVGLSDSSQDISTLERSSRNRGKREENIKISLLVQRRCLKQQMLGS